MGTILWEEIFLKKPDLKFVKDSKANKKYRVYIRRLIAYK